MPTIQIKTLTPVHIGSGRELMSNTEYLYFSDKRVFSVIDERKILDIIGAKNIGHWVNIIEKNESLLDYLQSRKREIQPQNIAKRVIGAKAGSFSNFKTLKEQLHDAREVPFMPGSSIKGAIRTVFVTTEALKNKRLASSNLKSYNKWNRTEKYDGQVLEKKLFGRTPNEDVFRFLHTGDAYFKRETVAIKANILSYYFEKWKYKNESNNLVECIPSGATAQFRLNFGDVHLQSREMREKASFLNIPNLFSTLNTHTAQLIQKEIDFWQREIDEVDVPESVDEMMDTLKWLKEQLNSCTENEAIIRIGFGSGWKFITGGWAINQDIMDDDQYYDDFLRTVRRKSYEDNVPFPKTRKVTESGNLLGFVKLSKI